MQNHSYHSLWLNGFHKVHYYTWGLSNPNKTVIAVHGLTRNARDFDYLGHYLSASYHVVCPDIVGRGKSDWLVNKADYGYPLYLSDMAALIARMNVDQINWIGTSMGGIIGMMLAAQTGTPIKKIVLNDVGSHISAASLQRLASYVGLNPLFDDLKSAEQYLRRTYSSFGYLTDDQWKHMTSHGVVKTNNGQYQLTYDPAIANVFRGVPIVDVDLSFFWLRVKCPVLLIRGSESDLLPKSTVQWMQLSNPNMRVVEFEGCGHAPHLMSSNQVEIIKRFLDE